MHTIVRRRRCGNRLAKALSRGGFTRIEAAVSVLTCFLLLGLALLVAGPSGHYRKRLPCALNLKALGTAGRTFANDHGGLYPWELPREEGGTLELAPSGPDTFRHFEALSNYIGMAIFLVCPQDSRAPATNFACIANTNVSYFVGADSDPKVPRSIMDGDRNITAASGVVLEWNPSAPPQWVKSVGLHGDRGNILFSDGHVQELDSFGLSNALQRAGMATNRFAVP